MKKKFLILSVLLTMGMLACQKEKTINNAAQNSAKAFLSGSPVDAKPGTVITSLLWKIGLFTINNDDLTKMFADYIFELASDNSAMATKGNIKIPGKWDVVNDQYYFYFDISNAFDPTSSVDYDLSFFNELNGYWDILKKYQSGVLLEMNINKRYKQLRLDRF